MPTKQQATTKPKPSGPIVAYQQWFDLLGYQSYERGCQKARHWRRIKRALAVLNKHKKRMHPLRNMLQCNVFRLLHSTGSCKFSVLAFSSDHVARHVHAPARRTEQWGCTGVLHLLCLLAGGSRTDGILCARALETTKGTRTWRLSLRTHL